MSWSVVWVVQKEWHCFLGYVSEIIWACRGDVPCDGVALKAVLFSVLPLPASLSPGLNSFLHERDESPAMNDDDAFNEYVG